MRADPKLGLAGVVGLALAAGAADLFEIHVLDAATGRGVPLVELQTVHNIRYMTDNAGRVAFDEPGLLGRRVFFFLRSPGYASPKDGFGMDGLAFDTRPGGRAEVKLKRTNIAERLYRITGAGLYDDTVRLGLPAPVPEPLVNAGVVGQDSTQAAVYRGRIRWFWGDTARAAYPLGNFLTTGAASDLPGRGGLAPSVGIALQYEAGTDGFVRAMAPGFGEGMVWVDGLCVVPDATNRPRLTVHYGRMKDLGQRLGHGIAVWDDEARVLRKACEFDNDKDWFRATGQAEVRDGFVYFAAPFPFVRAPARLEALLDPASYEALAPDAAGRPVWQKTKPPMTNVLLAAAGGGKVAIHGGSARWNEHRRKWVLIGNQAFGKASFLGEVWYSEAAAPEGPWAKAVQIATHPKYSFYNPVHHAFFDENGGRTIYFEGTYTATFSGNEHPTPRYDYNQLLYRLDLADPRLVAVFGPAPAR